MIFTQTQKTSQQLPIDVVSSTHDMDRPSDTLYHSYYTYHRLQQSGTR